MNFCPKCRKKLVVQDFCVECGADLSEYLNTDSSSDGIGSFDFSSLQNANEKLVEQIGLVIENGVLTGYTGKKTSVFIPSSVEEIFDKAFYSNTFITDVEIDNGVILIGKQAFANCRYLKRIKIPKSVKQIGEFAFCGTQLDYLVLDEYDKNILTSCLSGNAIKYLDAGNDVRTVVKEETLGVTINIKELEKQAIEYFNECKRKEQEERERRWREEARKRELLLADIGKVWTFGSYYVNNEHSKEPIEWIVIARQEGRAMLITKYAIAFKKYNETNASCHWPNCTLRTWLVNDFFNTAFSSSEKERMLTLKEAGEKAYNIASYPYSTVAEDKIFLLSKDNVFSYLKTPEQIQCKITPYAIRSYYRSIKELAHNAEGYNQYGASHWWLCGSAFQCGRSSYYTDFVRANGNISLAIDNGGSPVHFDEGVRPVIWINV